MTYVLHYAPDNASLIVRLALDLMEQPYETVLVDRSADGQRDPAYLALNPNGLIPTLITPYGPIFETAAILLWLVDRHNALGPAPAHPNRGDFLKWLLFCSNTVHQQLILLFYPQKVVGNDTRMQHVLRQGAQGNLITHFHTLERATTTAFGQESPTVIDLYIAAMLRWSAIYGPEDRSWFVLEDTPSLKDICLRIETLAATRIAQEREGLGPTPFSAPRRPSPPEGTAL